MKTKIIQALQSRTFWTGVLLFLVAGVEGIRDMIPASLQLPISAVLAILVGYFRVSPRQ